MSNRGGGQTDEDYEIREAHLLVALEQVWGPSHLALLEQAWGTCYLVALDLMWGTHRLGALVQVRRDPPVQKWRLSSS